MSEKLQTRLFKDLNSKTLFSSALDSAKSYLNAENSVIPTKHASEQLAIFDTDIPKLGNSQKTIEQLIEHGTPNTVRYSGGKYFGFVNGGILPAGLAARYLADTWDQNAALAVMSPIAAKLEEVCEKWMVEMLKLPKTSKLGLVGGTSVASLCGLAAARFHQYQKLDWDVNQSGLIGAPALKIIMGDQTHGTVTKMLKLLGFGENAIHRVKSDEQGRLLLNDLPELDECCIVILQAGNVCSGAFDDFNTICDLAKKAGAWVHVDGAFGLWAATSENFCYLTDGVEKADSWSIDGHKTLNTPYDCGMILCKHADALSQALHQDGSYIQHSQARDSMAFTPDMSRRARGIDLWACLHALGSQGVAELIELLHERARYFAQLLQCDDISVINDVVFNQVLIKCQSDKQTQAVLSAIQTSEEIWCGGAKWKGDAVIRLSVCSWQTSKKDIEQSAQLIRQFAKSA